jgi:predicted membrane protein
MNRRPPVTPALVLGLIILAFGVILFLDRQGLIDASRIFPFFWPGALLAVGLFKLALSNAGSGRVWGGILAAAGIVLILDRLNYLRVSLATLWPIALIVAGLLLVWRSIEGPAEPKATRSAGMLNELAVFGGGEFKSDDTDFRGGEAFAVFGGCQIDLRKASMQVSEAVIHANALFGGIEIRVPPSWSVLVHGIPMLGGYTDDTHHPSPEEGFEIKRLVVRGFAMFGGVAVKN